MTKIIVKKEINKIKLPFTATGWKSSKTPVIVKDNNAIAEIPKEKKKKE